MWTGSHRGISMTKSSSCTEIVMRGCRTFTDTLTVTSSSSSTLSSVSKHVLFFSSLCATSPPWRHTISLRRGPQNHTCHHCLQSSHCRSQWSTLGRSGAPVWWYILLRTSNLGMYWWPEVPDGLRLLGIESSGPSCHKHQEWTRCLAYWCRPCLRCACVPWRCGFLLRTVAHALLYVAVSSRAL
jgi:hypothetical protein